MDYFENDEDWRDYKEFMKKLLDIRIRSKKWVSKNSKEKEQISC
jgi:hypothetical protein